MADTRSEIAARTASLPADGLLASTRTARLDVSAATTIRGGRFLAGAAGDFTYIPVTVPEGVGELQVTCDYGPEGRSFLNIGLFGPQGHEVGTTAGFRGWSHGGRPGRRRVVLSEAEASPGYLPGPISAGTWHLALSPQVIPDGGLDWTLVVTLLRVPPGRVALPHPAATEVNRTPGWYRGDLHLHTVHSDGEQTPEEVSARAARLGLDFIVPTDHNTISAHLRWGDLDRPDLLVLPGEEVTTPAGHWGAVGLPPGVWVDFRYRPEDGELCRFVERVRGHGGLAVANHPRRGGGCDWEFDVAEMDGVEVWNGRWSASDDEAVRLWDGLLGAGRRLVAVGGSDSHRPEQEIGHPQTVVGAAGLSRDAVVAGLRAGRAYVAASSRVGLQLRAETAGAAAEMGGTLVTRPDETVSVTLHVRGAEGGRVTLHTDRGTVHEALVDRQAAAVIHETAPAACRYVRAEVRDRTGAMLALTNPVWIETTGGAGSAEI
jgi:hypothetical protein